MKKIGTVLVCVVLAVTLLYVINVAAVPSGEDIVSQIIEKLK